MRKCPCIVTCIAAVVAFAVPAFANDGKPTASKAINGASANPPITPQAPEIDSDRAWNPVDLNGSWNPTDNVTRPSIGKPGSNLSLVDANVRARDPSTWPWNLWDPWTPQSSFSKVPAADTESERPLVGNNGGVWYPSVDGAWPQGSSPWSPWSPWIATARWPNTSWSFHVAPDGSFWTPWTGWVWPKKAALSPNPNPDWVNQEPEEDSQEPTSQPVKSTLPNRGWQALAWVVGWFTAVTVAVAPIWVRRKWRMNTADPSQEDATSSDQDSWQD